MRLPIVLALLIAATAPLAADPLPPHKVMAVDDGESRRVVAVRLDQRFGEADLARIATAAHKGASEGKRTLVNFYLPGQKLTEPSWASAAFAPGLKITIHGLSREEEAAFRAEAARETRPVIGMWLTQAPAVPGLLAIYREKGKVYADWRVRGGHRTVEEVVETRGQHGRRFDIAADPTQHYVLIKGGELELREKAGLITVAEPVKADATLAKGGHVPVPLKTPLKAAQVSGAIIPAAGPPPAPIAQAPAVPAVKSPFSPVLSTPPGAGFTVTETVREPAAASVTAPPAQAASAKGPALGLAAAPHATASVAPMSERQASVATHAAPGKASKEPAKKRVAKAVPGAGAKVHTAAAATVTKSSKTFEADVSVINKRIVN